MANHEVSKPIAETVQRIVDRFDPEKIILFGSHAHGAAGPDSDVEARHPGHWEPFTRDEAEKAVVVARKVPATVRASLPKESVNG